MVFGKTKGAKANDEYKQGLVIKDTWRLVAQRNKLNKHDPAKKNVSKEVGCYSPQYLDHW